MPKRYLWWLILFLLPVSVSYAQTSDPTGAGAIFTYTSDDHASAIYFPESEWMPDGQSFVFTVYTDDDYRRPHLLQYFLASNELRSIDVSPLSLSLSSERQKMVGAVGTSSVAPDGNMIIYPVADEVCGEGGCSNVLALGDLKTGQHTTLVKGVDNGNFVRWSADSSAFLILDFGQYGGVGGIWYGKVPADIDSSTPIQLILLANFILGDVGYVDISRDGQRVLVRYIGDQTGKGLYVWDSRTPSSQQQFVAFADGKFILGDQVVAGASFIPDDERHLLVVAEAGIIQYDLETDTFKVINPAINSLTTPWMYFSPDLQYGLVKGGSLHEITSAQIKLIKIQNH